MGFCIALSITKSDILSKDAGQLPASLLKMSLFHRCFLKHFASKNQLPGFYINRTLVENGLITSTNHPIGLVKVNLDSSDHLRLT